MKRTETPKRYGRRAPMNEERNAALPAVPAASTKGSTGRQQVAAARTLPTAESAAASAPFEGGFAVVLIVSVLMDARPFLRATTHNARIAPFQPKRDADSDENKWPNRKAVDVSHTHV